MIFIAHRGNTRGRNIELENQPHYLNAAIALGYHVETDVWFENDTFYLGHDRPEHEINVNYLRSAMIWVHAKTLKTLNALLDYQDINCFYINRDRGTLTSIGYIWTSAYRRLELCDKTIVCLPERLGGGLYNFSECAGICSDNIIQYQEAYYDET